MVIAAAFSLIFRFGDSFVYYTIDSTLFVHCPDRSLRLISLRHANSSSAHVAANFVMDPFMQKKGLADSQIVACAFDLPVQKEFKAAKGRALQQDHVQCRDSAVTTRPPFSMSSMASGIVDRAE